MSDNIQHIDVDSDEFVDAPKALRDYAKKLKARYTETAKERDSYRSQAHSAVLSGVLGEFKNPERVKRDLLADQIDPTDSGAVERWLEDNAGDYARGDGASNPSRPDANAEDAAAQARLSSGADLRQPASMTAFEAAQAEITPDMSGPELIAIYRKHGL